MLVSAFRSFRNSNTLKPLKHIRYLSYDAILKLEILPWGFVPQDQIQLALKNALVEAEKHRISKVTLLKYFVENEFPSSSISIDINDKEEMRQAYLEFGVGYLTGLSCKQFKSGSIDAYKGLVDLFENSTDETDYVGDSSASDTGPKNAEDNLTTSYFGKKMFDLLVKPYSSQTLIPVMQIEKTSAELKEFHFLGRTLLLINSLAQRLLPDSLFKFWKAGTVATEVLLLRLQLLACEFGFSSELEINANIIIKSREKFHVYSNMLKNKTDPEVSDLVGNINYEEDFEKSEFGAKGAVFQDNSHLLTMCISVDPTHMYDPKTLRYWAEQVFVKKEFHTISQDDIPKHGKFNIHISSMNTVGLL